MRRKTRYLAAGYLGAALLAAGAVLPLSGRSPLGDIFLSAFPLAASGIILLALAAGVSLWRGVAKYAAVAAIAALCVGYPFFTRYYYPDGEGALYREPAHRAEAIPGWACLETGTLLVLAACLGLSFPREKK